MDKGDELMSKVVKEAELIVKDLDLLMYYDKEKLDKECSYYNGQVNGEMNGVECSIKILAKKMLEEKIDIKTIEKVTGLSGEEIKELEENDITKITALSDEVVTKLKEKNIL